MVRTDLSGPQIAVQATHAAIEVARNSLIPPHYDHPSVIICGVHGVSELQKCLAQIESLGIECKPFFENDLGNELTAFATAPVLQENRKHFRKYQLLKSSQMIERRVA